MVRFGIMQGRNRGEHIVILDRLTCLCYYVIVMKQLTQTIIINQFGTYKPGEFLPIWSGNELINFNEFLIYKAKRAAKHLLPPALR